MEATTVKLIATAPLKTLKLRPAGCPLWDNQRVEAFPAGTPLWDTRMILVCRVSNPVDDGAGRSNSFSRGKKSDDFRDLTAGKRKRTRSRRHEVNENPRLVVFLTSQGIGNLLLHNAVTVHSEVRETGTVFPAKRGVNGLSDLADLHLVAGKMSPSPSCER